LDHKKVWHFYSFEKVGEFSNRDHFTLDCNSLFDDETHFLNNFTRWKENKGMESPLIPAKPRSKVSLSRRFESLENGIDFIPWQAWTEQTSRLWKWVGLRALELFRWGFPVKTVAKQTSGTIKDIRNFWRWGLTQEKHSKHRQPAVEGFDPRMNRLCSSKYKSSTPLTKKWNSKFEILNEFLSLCFVSQYVW
jgi:hypothetical protein